MHRITRCLTFMSNICADTLYRAQNEAVDGVMAGFWGKCF